MAAIDQIRVAGGATGEQAARRTLRDQIARLERELSALAIATYPRLAWAGGGGAAGAPRAARDGGAAAAPRLLSLGELERARDALAARLSTLQAAAAEQRRRQQQAADELERMLADPPAHKWRRIAHRDLGIPGCGAYHVRPRAGLVGMLMGWWQVVVSSGCP